MHEWILQNIADNCTICLLADNIHCVFMERKGNFGPLCHILDRHSFAISSTHFCSRLPGPILAHCTSHHSGFMMLDLSVECYSVKDYHLYLIGTGTLVP